MLLTALCVLMASLAGCACFLAINASRAAVAARDELTAGLRKLSASREELAGLESRLNRVAGRVYSQSRRPKQPHYYDDDPADDIAAERAAVNSELDPELAAELALQSAPPVAPGKRGA